MTGPYRKNSPAGRGLTADVPRDNLSPIRNEPNRKRAQSEMSSLSLSLSISLYLSLYLYIYIYICIYWYILCVRGAAGRARGAPDAETGALGEWNRGGWTRGEWHFKFLSVIVWLLCFLFSFPPFSFPPFSFSREPTNGKSVRLCGLGGFRAGPGPPGDGDDQIVHY